MNQVIALLVKDLENKREILFDAIDDINKQLLELDYAEKLQDEVDFIVNQVTADNNNMDIIGPDSTKVCGKITPKKTKKQKKKACGMVLSAVRRKEQSKLSDAIWDLLDKSNYPLTTKEIAKALLDAGHMTSSNNFDDVVGHTLKEMEKVDKAERCPDGWLCVDPPEIISNVDMSQVEDPRDYEPDWDDLPQNENPYTSEKVPELVETGNEVNFVR